MHQPAPWAQTEQMKDWKLVVRMGDKPLNVSIYERA
jgi:hypothetical protein